ncbi:MAG: molecular chaperone DnaK [Bdellovibrionales bacterium]|nr:molecular chaperone DnaK [Bdellovibrionales bacterium]
MGKLIGIDLGTMNSCVAVMEQGEAVVIPNSEGSRTTPSVVAFTSKNEQLIGQAARRQSVTNPENTFFAIKRLIGRKFESPEVQKSVEVSPFRIIPSTNNDAWIQYGDKTLSPPEISGSVLQYMKEVAEEYLGEEVTDAIITVPAYFDDSQRQATKDAGKIAGLNVERIINEPTAAALAYGLDKKKNGLIAVFDLGGGTFDVSILEIADDVFQVKATCGDTFLGGEDFDNRIVDWMIEEFQKLNSIDLKSDRMALQRLKEAAEKAKHELSSSDSTDINLPFIFADASGPKHLNLTLERTQFENLVKDLIERLNGPCETALKDAGLSSTQIDEIVLVGGMTRMPKVAEKAKEIFGKEPAANINPDEVVAIGAAIQGAILRGEFDNVLLLDVTPLSLGVETQGGVFTKIIEKNTTIPTKKSQVFSTTLDNQNSVRIHVLQGERELSQDNKSLAVFDLIGIPPAPRGIPQIEVTFEIDTNGIVSVGAKDLATSREQAVRVNPASGLSEQEIERIINEAQDNAKVDEENKLLVEAKNELEGLLYSAKKSFQFLAAKISEEEKQELEASLEKAEAAMDSADIEEVRGSLELLNEVSHKIAEMIYSGTNQTV